jgi:hypothetical protein
MEIKVISSLDEITEVDVYYAHTSRPHKYIKLDLDTDGTISIYGKICGDHPTFVSSGQYVKSWKSVRTAIKALKIYANDGSWGMGHWGETYKD